MKKITMIFIGILLIGIVTAGIGISLLDLTQTKTISSDARNAILNKHNITAINPNITIQKDGNNCLWSAKQDGVINVLETWFDCTGMTDNEMKSYVGNEVSTFLENYGEQINIRDNYTDWGEGVIRINEG